MGIQPVTSPANPLLRDVRKAIARGTLTSERLAVAEGFHLLEEAARSKCEVPVVLATESVANKRTLPIPNQQETRVVIVDDRLFETLATTETSQGVIALVRPPLWRFEDLLRGQSLVVVLDGIQDPGNAGAIVRTAEAFGATGVVFLRGTVSPWNPKTLRASAGSLFRVPIAIGADPTKALEAFRAGGVEIYAAMPFTGSERLAGATDFRQKCALAIGSEGRGIGEHVRAAATPVAIPTRTVESLNAATAAAVLLYEAARQRGTQ